MQQALELRVSKGQSCFSGSEHTGHGTLFGLEDFPRAAGEKERYFQELFANGEVTYINLSHPEKKTSWLLVGSKGIDYVGVL